MLSEEGQTLIKEILLSGYQEYEPAQLEDGSWTTCAAFTDRDLYIVIRRSLIFGWMWICGAKTRGRTTESAYFKTDVEAIEDLLRTGLKSR
jgi:hypothetical protein